MEVLVPKAHTATRGLVVERGMDVYGVDFLHQQAWAWTTQP